MPSYTTESLPILVVDDDSALIRTLSDILRVHGYAPDTAGTAGEGLRLAQSRPPALAVVDLRLPDMDGIELVAKLHQLSELTQVVVLTGNASVESAIAAMREHSVDYLLKPVQVEKLLQVVSVAGERFQRRTAQRFLEVRARQQAAVASFGQRALVAEELDQLCQEAVELVAATLELPQVALLEHRANGALQVHSGHGLRSPLPADDAAIREQHGVIVVVDVEIPAPGKPYGTLVGYDRAERSFSQDDRHFLQAMAHILGTTLDRRRTEGRLRQAQRLEAVGRLAGGVAHDFNNVLTAITGYGEMLRAEVPEGSAAREDVDEILKAAKRAADLTKQLLAFSRQQVLQPRLVNLSEIVQDVESLVRRLLTADVELATSLEPYLHATRADPGQVEQVIVNLCVNARDAMPDGGTLTIETANVQLDQPESSEHSNAAPGAYVMLAVTDTGTGMDAETKARIYEPFFTTKPTDKGTGLGLATVYGIVKQTGGEIFVYSELGEGTTFKVYFPVVAGRPDEVTAAAGPVSDRSVQVATVLLAEDEEPVRRLAQRVLEQEGYTVLVARGGIEARTISDSHPGPIDLLVTDMIMPTVNGRELADQLRTTRPGLRVLFLSGYTDVVATRKGLLPPRASFLEKPFTSEGLARRVRQMLAEVTA